MQLVHLIGPVYGPEHEMRSRIPITITCMGTLYSVCLHDLLESEYERITRAVDVTLPYRLGNQANPRHPTGWRNFHVPNAVRMDGTYRLGDTWRYKNPWAHGG